MKIDVYIKPSCEGCTATYRALDSNGIEYKTHNVQEDPAALEMFKRMNETKAPLVMTPWGHWVGFRPELIDALAALQQREQVTMQAASDQAAATVKLMVLIENSSTRSVQNEPTFTAPAGEPDEYPLRTLN